MSSSIPLFQPREEEHKNTNTKEVIYMSRQIGKEMQVNFVKYCITGIFYRHLIFAIFALLMKAPK